MKATSTKNLPNDKNMVVNASTLGFWNMSWPSPKKYLVDPLSWKPTSRTTIQIKTTRQKQLVAIASGQNQ